MHRYRTAFIYWFPAVFATILVLYLSLTPVTHVQLGLRVSDKILHLLAYICLGVLWTRTVKYTWRCISFQTSLILIISITLYGVLIEIGQIYTGRYFEIADIIADAVGSIVGVTGYSLMNRK